TPARFVLITATEEDRSALRGLGTYGIIRGATGFILGAVQRGTKDMEDFAFLMEEIVLRATELGLGTCWLGGTYTRSSFARKITLREGEVLPALVAAGYIAGRRSLMDWVVRGPISQGDRRLAWERLFFDGDFDHPLREEAAGAYAIPLKMVRLGPSASNKQPWRIVRDGAPLTPADQSEPGASQTASGPALSGDAKGDTWHFYVQRTPGYPPTLGKPFVYGDLQRMDMGIAMCHWALSAAELGLPGAWAVQEPAIARPDERTEYIVSWIAP
ncbi:MAG: nitroreductase family protein, partial [Anaerolineae bacterium]|nr:nitroreductase family protein [Anaerolineae bacterium]